MVINTKLTGHGHGKSSENVSEGLPRDFPRGYIKVSSNGKGGNYEPGHICWINWPPYLHPPMWAPDTETTFKLHSVLFGFYHKKKEKCVLGVWQISLVLDGDPLSLTFTFLLLLTQKILRNSFR